MNIDPPYLIIHRYYKPKEGVDTRRADWADDGLQMLERCEVVDRPSKRHKRDAILIIDILNMKITKNSTSLMSDEALRFYSVQYAQEIAKGVDKWLSRREGKKK